MVSNAYPISVTSTAPCKSELPPPEVVLDSVAVVVVVELLEDVPPPAVELVDPGVLDVVLFSTGVKISHEINIPIRMENAMIIAKNLFIVLPFLVL